MNYNIFLKKTKGKKGKNVKKWYYWYFDDNGKQKQKICKGCSTKAEAMAFVNSLPVPGERKFSVRDIAQNMFLLGSDHAKRREALGKSVLEITMHEARGYINCIIERWGDYDIREIEVGKVGDYLLSVNRSGSWKKRYISIFYDIFDEAAWQGIKVSRPLFPSFVRGKGKSDVFSSNELKTFFVPENFTGSEVDSNTFCLFFLVSVFAGLRLSEARALRPQQFLFDKNALVIDGFCKADGTRTTFNKKGTPDNPKLRIVLLPERITAQVQEYIEERGIANDDFIFTYKNRPLSMHITESAFKRALKKAGIATDSRHLTPQSLRYTYVTKMRRTLPIDTVRKLVGHADDKMTDYYTRVSIEDGLASIAGTKNAVENLFD